MVISSQSDGKTATDRLEGLVMGIADFHVQMNFLKMGYKVLFSVSKAKVLVHICTKNKAVMCL